MTDSIIIDIILVFIQITYAVELKNAKIIMIIT